MASYPCDPLPHQPPGTNIVELNGHRRHCTYHYLGGSSIVESYEWVISTLAPPPDPDQFDTDIQLICHFLDQTWGFHLVETSCCAMGAAMVRFASAVDLDTAIGQSPYFIGDSTLCVIRHDRGINHRDCTFNMMVNYLLTAWRPEKVRESVSGFEKFLVWNKDVSNRARVLVKVRVPSLLDIPASHVMCENLDDVGHGQSWTCAVYILQADLLGAIGGDEDPIPPDGVLHPMPNALFGGVWVDADFQEDHMPEGRDDPVVDGNGVPMIPTPPISPDHKHGAAPAANHLQHAVEAMDCFVALQDMMSKLMVSAPDILNKLEGMTVTAAKCQMMDVTDEFGNIRKCRFFVYTEEQPAPFISNCTITEITEPTVDSTHNSITESIPMQPPP